MEFQGDIDIIKNFQFFLILPFLKLKKKNLMAKKIQRSYFRYQQIKSLRRLFKSIRRIQTLFRVKNEYKKFKTAQKSIRIIQKFVKHRIMKKKLGELFANVAKQKGSATKISAFYRMKRSKRKYVLMKKATNLIKSKYCAYVKDKKRKARNLCHELVKQTIFELAWLKIRLKIENAAVIIIQKYMRSVLTRIKFSAIVRKIQKKRFFLFDLILFLMIEIGENLRKMQPL